MWAGMMMLFKVAYYVHVTLLLAGNLHTPYEPPLVVYYSVPQNFVVFALFRCSTKHCSILIPLLLRVVYIPKSNTIDVSCQ